ncbi:MAG: DUF3047 domain-containing protein [Candidatus Acidiferrales bacterium]
MAAKVIAFAFLTAFLTSSVAETLTFTPDPGRAGWSTVSFPGIASARFSVSKDGTLLIATDSAAGLLWRNVSGAMQAAHTAHWRWRVDEGVAPTDLSKRGVDDRALGVYFVFDDRPDVPKSAMTIFDSASVTSLVYVFGGNKPRGSIIDSPHMGRRGKFIVLRIADAPKRVWFDESVDLAQDYFHVFGKPLPNLIAIAIESDSDDTRARNRAELQAFIVGK